MHMVEGYLGRRGRHLKSWRRRYFIFEDGMLLHKKNDDLTTRVLDEDRVFDVLYWSGRPHGLCLKLRGNRLVYLTARSEEDAARWHDTIESYLTKQRCIEDLRRALCRGRLPSIRESTASLMSLFASTINPAPTANGSITFGPPATSGFGGPVTAGFGFGSARSGGFGNASSGSNVVSSAMWADNASEPFGRVESTRRCFARNGKVAATSEWTLPKPPSRPLFQSSSGFHSSSRDRVSLFGQSTQSTTLFGASGSNSSGNEATVGGGGFTFGFAAPATKTGALFGTANAGFGGDVGQETTTTLFGNTDNVSESQVDPGFVATRKVFGNSGGFLEASREDSGFGETRTVFGSGSSTAKPPLAPSWNPFASSTKQVGFSSNPFAPTSPSTSNPFTFTPPPRSTGNPLATTMSANASVNPFVTKVSANTTVNPFAVKASSNASVNPFAVKTSSNVTVESVRDTSKKLSSVPGSSSSVEFKSGLHPAFNMDSSPWCSRSQQQQQTLAPTCVSRQLRLD
ncbi:hypothetical protein PI124_g9914 [Phytophthora idaei]|nr:hypothetical protein PI124_g9914 [Phytophthora idaei]